MNSTTEERHNIQADFLNRHRREKTLMLVIMCNGFQMRGTIIGFDNFAILMEVDGRENLLYKTAISTIRQAPYGPPASRGGDTASWKTERPSDC